jgi:hypothetical protein
VQNDGQNQSKGAPDTPARTNALEDTVVDFILDDETAVFDGSDRTLIADPPDPSWAAVAKMEDTISARIQEFDPGALLHLLSHMGYSTDQIKHEGAYTTTSQASLLQSISFDAGRGSVSIVWNLGLLSSQSPLPSYFFKKMESGDIDTAAFVTFLGFFNESLLSAYWAGVYPEFNPKLFPDWGVATRRTLNTRNLRSPDALHWICQCYFPELHVLVERCVAQRDVTTRSIRLGEVNIGDGSVFGDKASIAVNCLRVVLTCKRPERVPGQPWTAEIRRRLTEYVFPILAPLEIEIELVQVITKMDPVGAKLAADNFLGFQRTHGDKSKEGRVVLYRGRVSV